MNGLLKLFQGSIILELLKSLVKFIGTIIIQQHIRYSSFTCQRPNRYELFRLTPFAFLCLNNFTLMLRISLYMKLFLCVWVKGEIHA